MNDILLIAVCFVCYVASIPIAYVFSRKYLLMPPDPDGFLARLHVVWPVIYAGLAVISIAVIVKVFIFGGGTKRDE
jgi:hypothetical protein